MMQGFFSAVKKVVGDNDTMERFRAAVIENRLEDVNRSVEEEHVDIDADLTLGKLGNLSQFTPTWMKAMHEENTNNLGYRAIHWAARNGSIELLRYLCEQGANVNVTNFIGNTSLHVACYYNQKESIGVLLEYQPDVNMQNTGSLLGGVKESFAPLHYAALYGDTEIVELLIKAGAMVDIKGLYNLTPLHFAANIGNIENVANLLSVDNDINCQDVDGKTPLHHAVLASLTNPLAFKVVLFLLEHQAMLNLEDNKGNTPLELFIKTASEQGADITLEQLQMVQYLLEWGADKERFDACIYETKSFNFTLELNHFLLKQCAEQKAELLSLKQTQAQEIKPSISTPLSISTDGTQELPEQNPIDSNIPSLLSRPPTPPPPPDNNKTKKYRETTVKTKTVMPTSTQANDFMTALKKRIEAKRSAIILSSSETEEDSWSFEEEIVSGTKKAGMRR